MNRKKENPLVDKQGVFHFLPATISDLAEVYVVHRKTMRRWLEPFSEKIGVKRGYYFSSAQVKIIVDQLGLPDYENLYKTT